MCVRRLWGWFWIKERKSHFFPQHTLYVFTTIKLIFLNSLVLCALFSQNVLKHISWEWDSITDRGKPNTISENVKCLLVISLIQCIQSVKKNNIHRQALIIPPPGKTAIEQLFNPPTFMAQVQHKKRCLKKVQNCRFDCPKQGHKLQLKLPKTE